MRTRLGLTLGLALLIGLAGATPVHALLITITGSDGTTTVTNVGPSPENYGPVTVGSWTAQGTAIGTPPLDLGSLFSNTLAVNTDGPGTFTLWVTEAGLTGPLGEVDFFSGLTTNLLTGAITSVTETTSLQLNNTVPGPFVPIGTILDTATFTTSLQTQSAHFLIDPGAGPYSLTERYIINATGAGSANLTIDLQALQPVPEPSTMMLMGSGLVGVVAYARRRLFKS